MATVYTHSAVGLGLAGIVFGRRLPPWFWVLAGLLPIVPDFDTFFSARYGSDLGHRGVSHSFLFALLLSGLAAALTFRYFKIRFTLLWLFFFAITASHGVLDVLTKGGFGVPLFWPISYRFGPWGPIPVADIGFEPPNPFRSRAVRSELLWVWLPLGLALGVATLWRRIK
jgi:inner membrane protein